MNSYYPAFDPSRLIAYFAIKFAILIVRVRGTAFRFVIGVGWIGRLVGIGGRGRLAGCWCFLFIIGRLAVPIFSALLFILTASACFFIVILIF
jgi:hypothetical protein